MCGYKYQPLKNETSLSIPCVLPICSHLTLHPRFEVLLTRLYSGFTEYDPCFLMEDELQFLRSVPCTAQDDKDLITMHIHFVYITLISKINFQSFSDTKEIKINSIFYQNFIYWDTNGWYTLSRFLEIRFTCVCRWDRGGSRRSGECIQNLIFKTDIKSFNIGYAALSWHILNNCLYLQQIKIMISIANLVL